MKKIMSLGLILFFSTASSAQEIQGYLCISWGSTSLILDRKSENVKKEDEVTKGDKFIIIPNNRQDGLWENIKWEVKEFGSEFPFYTCGEFSGKYLRCSNLLGEAFVFNKEYLRFYILTPGIFFNDLQIGDPILYSEVGTCTKL